jgi:hypothetical protein
MTTPIQKRRSLPPTAALAVVVALAAYPTALTAQTTTLANAYLEQPYSVTLQSTFGTAPYKYQITSGALPSGVTLGSSGTISGTPTTPYVFSFAVLVTDSSVPPVQETVNYTLNVRIAYTTFHYDNYRSGATLTETNLTTANVNVNTFGKLRSFPVTGWVIASPLYVPGVTVNGVVHNLIFIATTQDQVYAFDVNSGALIWQRNFLFTSGIIQVTALGSPAINCTSFTDGVGIMGTPVINTQTQTMYLVAKTQRYNSSTLQTQYNTTLHAMNITTGADIVTTVINPSAPGGGTGSVNGVVPFDSLVENQRSALLLYNGAVFIAFGSYCDHGLYHGWVTAYNATTLAFEGAFIDTPNGQEGGLWSVTGPAVDSSGFIYDTTGNGDFTANTTGPGNNDYGDTTIKWSWSATGTPHFNVVDYFTPWNAATLDSQDGDFGGGGIILLPDQPGATYPHLLLQAGKEGTIDLINRDNMGHFSGTTSDSQIPQTLLLALGQPVTHPYAALHSAPAFWNNNVYYGSNFDTLKAFSFNPTTQLLSTTPTSQSPETFGRPGQSATVSANGTANGIVWIIEADKFPQPAILRAYQATNLANEIYNSTQNSARDQAGPAVQLASPTVIDGKVFVPVENAVDMYGLLPPP